MNAGSVSVVVPAHDAEAFLGEALESVLQQTAPPYEVIVVDDGSTDASARVARGFGPRVTCVSLPHAGAAAAVNAGVSLARGARLAFLDADDVWAAAKLELQGAALDAHPAIDMAFGHVVQFQEGGSHGAPEPGYSRGTMLVRRTSFDRVGLLDTRWRVGEFVEWYLRAQDVGLRATMLPDVVMRRRLHAGNLGRREPGARVDFARIVKAALDRRRAAARGAAD